MENDNSLLPIAIFVTAAHAVALYWLAEPSPPKTFAPPTERLVVNTVALGETKPMPVPKKKIEPPKEIAEATVQETIEPPPPEPIPPPKKKEEPKKATVEAKPVPEKKTPPPKKEVAKAPAKKDPPKKEVVKSESKPKKDPPTKKELPKTVKQEPPKPDPQIAAAEAKKRELLTKAQESIAKIDKSRDKITANKVSASAMPNVPGSINKLQIDALPSISGSPLSSRETSYCEELASRLKLLLHPPERGDVKVKLTLERSGHFVKVEIVSATSAPNRKYFEQMLPTLSYPGFGSNFDNLAQYTFVISLTE